MKVSRSILALLVAAGVVSCGDSGVDNRVPEKLASIEAIARELEQQISAGPIGDAAMVAETDRALQELHSLAALESSTGIPELAGELARRLEHFSNRPQVMTPDGGGTNHRHALELVKKLDGFVGAARTKQ